MSLFLFEQQSQISSKLFQIKHSPQELEDVLKEVGKVCHAKINSSTVHSLFFFFVCVPICSLIYLFFHSSFHLIFKICRHMLILLAFPVSDLCQRFVSNNSYNAETKLSTKTYNEVSNFSFFISISY